MYGRGLKPALFDMRNLLLKLIVRLILCGMIAMPIGASAQTAKPAWQTDWDKTIELAKKEGKVVVSLTTSAELRAAIEKQFEKRFGIDVEPVVGRATSVIRKIIDESRAGVGYVDVHIGGSESVITGLLPEGILQAVEPAMMLPEVRDPKQWWGGHLWVDNAKRFAYTSMAHLSETLWYNPQRFKGEEFQSFDDLLDERLQGKIALLDPRTPGSGASLWAYLRDIKGEDYLKRLVGQKLLISRDQRILAENLAKGSSSIVMGLGYYSFATFIKSGLPIQALPTAKEGNYISGGSGHLVILKNAPHANARNLFANWFLSREGQDIYGKALGQGSRRFDVDTKWLRDIGISAAKDVLAIEQYYKRENQSEDKIHRSREPAAALARKLFD
jgi:ABC-type Fe3+ transport system substrate-binding protein